MRRLEPTLSLETRFVAAWCSNLEKLHIPVFILLNFDVSFWFVGTVQLYGMLLLCIVKLFMGFPVGTCLSLFYAWSSILAWMSGWRLHGCMNFLVHVIRRTCQGTESLACINLSLILAVLDNIENTLSRWKSVCVHNHFKAFALHFFLQTAYSCMRTLTCVFDIVEVCFVFATSWGVGRSCFA